MKKITLALFTCLFLAACTPPETNNVQPTNPIIAEITETPTAAPPYTPPEHRIGIRQGENGAEFYDKTTGETFVVRGANYFNIIPVSGGLQDRAMGVGVFDPDAVNADFQLLHEYGYNTVRIFLDSCNGGPNCMAIPNGQGLNPEYLDNIVSMMEIAKHNSMFILFTSNDIPDDGGYGEMANRGSNATFAGYRNAHFLTAEGIQAGERYWSDLLQGLIERQAPLDAVLGWSLLNEQWYFIDQPPFSLTSGEATTANGTTYDLSDPEQKRQMAVDGTLYLIEQWQAAILEQDPTALVTMGVFHPDYPNPSRIGDFKYVETAQLLDKAALNFFDFHAYPGVELNLPQYVENFGMLGYDEKPIIMGEVGAFIDRYPSEESAARSIQQWIADSCEYGYDGWLYWGFMRAPEAIGDATWGFTDGKRLLLESLAPANQPDPCQTTEIAGGNIAYGKEVRASNWLAAEPPQNAVDGGPLAWGSGAEPTQWIEIDLGAPATIETIRLAVAQYPNGNTVHQVLGRTPDGNFEVLVEFRENTADGDILEFTPETPLESIQYIRVVTISSPSWVAWREIEVIGSFAP